MRYLRLGGKLGDPFGIGIDKDVRKRNKRIEVIATNRCEGSFQLVGAAELDRTK